MTGRYCNEMCPVPGFVSELRNGRLAVDDEGVTDDKIVFCGNNKIIAAALPTEKQIMFARKTVGDVEEWESGCNLETEIADEGKNKHGGAGGHPMRCNHLDNTWLYISLITTKR